MIVPLTLNSSSIRDIARVLLVSPYTVLKTLRLAAAPLAELVPPRSLIASVCPLTGIALARTAR